MVNDGRDELYSRLQNAVKVGATAAGIVISGSLMMSSQAFAGDPVKWKMQSAYPGSLVQLGTSGKDFAEQVKRISGGDFKIRFYEPNALVPALEILDAVKAGSIDAGWASAGFWAGKIPAAAFFGSVPFGPGSGEYMAWVDYGGGQEIWDSLYEPHGIKGLPCAMLAPEASGWFRSEISSVDDLKGLKMRFFGLGARVMEKLGVSTQLLAPGDIFPALERGTLDATEFSQPAIDLNLGFYQVAKHYYFPGWHQQSTYLELLVNLDKWNALSDSQRAQIETACRANIQKTIAEGEAIQIAALKTLEEKGVQIHQWPPEIVETLDAAWRDVAAEEAAKDPDFKKVWDSLSTFREDYQTWNSLAYLK